MKLADAAPMVARNAVRFPAFLRAQLATNSATWTTVLALSVILLGGLYLRTINVNWDRNQHLHPDERFQSIISARIQLPGSVGEYFNSGESKLNPYNVNDTYVYGTFPLFLNKAVSEWLDRDEDGTTHASADLLRDVLRPFGVDMERPNGSFTFDGGYNSNLVGRVLSAIADVLTIALVFELGRVVYSRRVGLLAAALVSLAVLHIQYSHFFGAETWLALFVTAAIYFSVRITKSPSIWNYLWAGLACGLALSTKLNALPVLGIPALAILVRSWPWLSQARAFVLERNFRGVRSLWRQAVVPVGGGLLVLLVMGLTFRTLQPYAFDATGFFDVFDLSLNLKRDVLSLDGLKRLGPIDPSNYFDLSEKFETDIARLQDLQKGSDYPPNTQWINRPFLWFPLKNMIVWGMGLPLGLAALGSLAFASYRLWFKRDVTSLLLIVWVVGFFLFSARGFVPTMRYFIPLYPAFILLAAYGLTRLWDAARSGEATRWLPRRFAGEAYLVKPVLLGTVAIVVGGTLVWALAFTGVYRQDVSRIQATYWMVENIPEGSTTTTQEWDDAIPMILPGVDPSRIDQVLLKPYIPDSPEKVAELVAGLDEAEYVVETSNRIYDSVTRFPARYPSTTRYYQYLFDGTLGFHKIAEFTNYPSLFGIDIPDQAAEEAFTVYDHPKVTIWAKTTTYSHDRAMELLNPDRASTAVNLQPADAAYNATLLRPGDLEAQQDGGTWSDVFTEGGFVGSFPTLLWLIALEAAALAITPVALVLFKRLPDRGYLLAKPLGMLALGFLVWFVVSIKLVDFSQTTVVMCLVALMLLGWNVWSWSGNDTAQFLRKHWRLIVFCEALFLLAFFLARELRMANPDLWHPARGGEKPMDLAFFTAVTRSTTMPPYDPWFAGGYINYYYFGQFLSATLTRLTTIPPEVAYNLLVPTYFALTIGGAFSVAYNLAAAAKARMRGRWGAPSPPGWTLYAAGMLAVFLVAIAGNLDAIGQLVERLSEVSHTRADTNLPLVDSIVNSAGGLWQVLVHGADLRDFDFWRPSRMLAPSNAITEFPYFSFLFADLHAHLMAMPFQLLTIGACFALVLGARHQRNFTGSLVRIAVLGWVIGALRCINSWDYPTFMLLGAAAVLISERLESGGLRAFGGRVLVKLGVMAAFATLPYLPFTANYDAPVSGITDSPETTPVPNYLAHFGIPAALIAAWLLAMCWLTLRPALVARVQATRRGRIAIVGAAAMALVVLGVSVLLVLNGQPLIAALLPVLAVVTLLGAWTFARDGLQGNVILFILALIGLGLGLSMGVDVVTVEGDIGRMNTVFKFYLHIWVLLALAAAFATWQLAFVLGPVLLAASPRRMQYGSRLAFGALGVLLLAGLLYPLLATPVRLDDRFADTPRTLNGMAYMQVADYGERDTSIDFEAELAGIQWMRRNVEGTPTIVEAKPELYHWGSRFAIYTGLPAVIGWDWHERQQRGVLAPVVTKRGEEVDGFYTTSSVSEALAFLRRYEVRYVVLGQLERIYYPGDGLTKFESGLDGTLEVVYENSDLTIYEVHLAEAE